MKKQTKSKFILIFSFLLIAGNIAFCQIERNVAEWKSPHALHELSSAPVAIIPFPQKVQWTKEKWQLPDDVLIAVYEHNQSATFNSVRSLSELFSNLSIKPQLKIIKTDEKLTVNSILLEHDNSSDAKAESYHLQITKTGIIIHAKDAAGFYYAALTLRQIIVQAKTLKQIPGCVINDWPAFSLRGFMHDNGRNFQSIETLKVQLDKLSWYKFNTFHWHITDNPAWRPQSKIYPQLNDPKKRMAGRDPDSSYSFDDIRELIRYAKERCISIIPELDMPGHSKYFAPTFGFKMESEEGMQVLEKLIDEFCQEIPVADCPIIHLGSDEVHIPNPKVFIQRMTARVKANNRKVMVWNPGLTPEDGTIEQLWREDDTKGQRTSPNPYIDSYGGYLNNYDVFSLVQRYFFQQVCNKPVGDSSALGGIVCCWPDTRVDDKSKIVLYNAIWPASLTYSEAVWCGRPSYAPAYVNALPPKETSAYKYFREFEIRLARHRDIFFQDDYFPYVQFGSSEWKLSGPYHRQKTDSASKAFAPELTAAKDTTWSTIITGGILQMSIRTDPKLLATFPDETVYLTGYIYSSQPKEINAILGFEAAARSNRRSGGVPLNGKWDANGGAVFINREELQGPQWANPGGNRYLHNTWDQPGNEIPYTDEEFFWSRPPAKIKLKKGWNEIVVRVPRAYKEQRWIFAFAAVKKDAKGNWVEDATVQIKATKE